VIEKPTPAVHAHPVDQWQHDHDFLGAAHARNERRIRWVVGLTLVMMIGEIAAGTIYGSMALLADGWHMGTHAGAMSVSAAAYAFARRKARDSRYVFGTGKVGDLAGFTSAVMLVGVACVIGFESFKRLVNPSPIRFDEAILVAVLGLVVNLVSAILLHEKRDAHHHDHGEDGHHDHNLRSAHLHVLADALTSVFAIGALCVGKFLNWTWMDPLCGILGAAVIVRWSWGLLRDTGAVLLDVEPDPQLLTRIRGRIEGDSGDKITDLHVWRLGPGHFAAIISIVSDEPRAPDYYKGLLRDIEHLAHVTVEVHPCAGDPR
jgi:cation diffusion facilitator family transporter